MMKMNRCGCCFSHIRTQTVSNCFVARVIKMNFLYKYKNWLSRERHEDVLVAPPGEWVVCVRARVCMCIRRSQSAICRVSSTLILSGIQESRDRQARNWLLTLMTMHNNKDYDTTRTPPSAVSTNDEYIGGGIWCSYHGVQLYCGEKYSHRK